MGTINTSEQSKECTNATTFLILDSFVKRTDRTSYKIFLHGTGLKVPDFVTRPIVQLGQTSLELSVYSSHVTGLKLVGCGVVR